MHRVWVLFLALGLLRGQGPCVASAELRRLYEADQKDREPEAINWDLVRPRDAQRRDRVMAILNTLTQWCADDLYHAAMVLQHGEASHHYLLAHVLASASAAKGYEVARWLCAATLDRYLQAVGQPQVFGTQYLKKDPSAAWTQEAFDRKALPDAIRTLFTVPTLAEQQKRLEQMNRSLERK